MGARRSGRQIRRAAAAAIVEAGQPAAGAHAADAADGGARHGRLGRQRALHRRPHEGAHMGQGWGQGRAHPLLSDRIAGARQVAAAST